MMLFSYDTALAAVKVQSARFPMLTYRILRLGTEREGWGYLARCETEQGPAGWIDLPFDPADWGGWRVVEAWKGGERIADNRGAFERERDTALAEIAAALRHG